MLLEARKQTALLKIKYNLYNHNFNDFSINLNIFGPMPIAIKWLVEEVMLKVWNGI